MLNKEQLLISALFITVNDQMENQYYYEKIKAHDRQHTFYYHPASFI